MSNPLEQFKDNVSRNLFGITKQEAIDKEICIDCKHTIRFGGEVANLPGDIYSDAGRREYYISGLCEFCFDNVFKEKQ